jgi:hypothetical protein
LEPLEPRLLMSAAPVPVPELALQEIAIEPAAAVIQGTTTVLALTGDAAPASGAGTGGTFSGFNAPDLNDAGQSAFFASVTGSPSTEGIFRSSGPGLVTALARFGEAAPASGAGTGGTLSVINALFLNDAGQATFVANVTGSTSTQGIFRSSGPGLVTALARVGEAAPASGVGTGGTFTNFGAPPLNDAGQTVFLANVTGSTSIQGIFRSSGPGLVTALAREDEAAPSSGAGTGGTFSGFGTPALNKAGQAAFLANVIGSTSIQGIFRSSGPGLVTALARAGEFAPFLGGGTQGIFSGFGTPVLNDAGQVAFLANMTGSGFSNQGIFRSSGPGLVTLLARASDAAPATGAGTDGLFNSFGTPALNNAGQVAFKGLVFGSTSDSGIFRGSGPGLVTALVRALDVAPDGNGSFVTFSDPQLLKGGNVVFQGNLTGTARGAADDTGIFLSDGQEMFQVAREGQALAGSTITGLSFLFFPDLGGRTPVNDVGQVVYQATLADGRQAIVLVTPELHYRSASSGAWDTSSNWSVSLTPGAVHDLFIDPLNGLTVTGPGAATTVDSLTIGSKASGMTTLRLNGGGNLSVTNGIAIQSLGALDQQLGTVTTTQLTNAGSVTQAAGSVFALSSLFNTGSALFNGQATVVSSLQNRGSLSIGSGGTLTASGTPINFGTFILDNGVFNGGTEFFRNEVGGNLSGRGTINADLLNSGTLDTTGLLTLAQGAGNDGRILIGLGEMLALQGALTSGGLIDLTSGGITGAGPLINLSGGIIRGSGSVTTPVTNQGLIHASGNGLLVIDLSGGNNVSGELQVEDASTLSVTTAFTSAGATVLKGASATLRHHVKIS